MTGKIMICDGCTKDVKVLDGMIGGFTPSTLHWVTVSKSPTPNQETSSLELTIFAAKNVSRHF